MLRTYGRGLYRWRYAVLVLWVVVVALGGVLGGGVFDRASDLDSIDVHTESGRVSRLVDDADPEGAHITILLAGRDYFATDLIEQASREIFRIRDLPGVLEVRDAYTSGANEQIAMDGKGSVVAVTLSPDLSEAEESKVAERVAEIARGIDVPEVLVGGEFFAEQEFADRATSDAARGEGIALVGVVGVLVVVLGGLLVGSLPVVTALAAAAGSLLALRGLVALTDVSEYAVNVVTLLGLGLAVDFSLLVIARFRDERAADRRTDALDLSDLLGRTMATAGRAVLVSGLAAGTAMAGLLFFADPLLSATALGGLVAVVVATLAGLTLVPALVAVAHRRIPPAGERLWPRGPARPDRGLLSRLAGFAQRQPLPVMLGSVGVLLALAVPVLSINLANSDARSLPKDSESRQIAAAIKRDYPELRTEPITLLVDRTEDGDLTEVSSKLEDLDGIKSHFLVDELPDGVLARLHVTPEGTTDGKTAQALVRDIRALGYDVLVGGPAAELVDAKDDTRSRLPVAIAVVALATALLLFVLTGSVVVPIKTLVLNLLSLVATLGVVVAIFQWGWGASLLGFDSWGAIDLTTPLLIFMFSFGLSMDYHVFLLARIKEAWERERAKSRKKRDAGSARDRAASDRAVLDGITASSHVVTTAAVAISLVFLGFALGDLLAVKEIGVGMTVAVVIDVTIVRGLLLPASMTLLGRWNWWRPGRG